MPAKRNMATRYLIFLIILSHLLSGCGATAKFVYPSNPQNLLKLYEQPKYDLEVAILPFEEARGDKNSISGALLYLIPLVPFSSYQYQRPDAARWFNSIGEFQFNVTEDIPKAVVTSLKKSNLFKNVYFSFGGDIQNADLLVNGTVKSTLYEGKLYTYCLSVFGPLLWVFGLPAGTSVNQLNLQITLNTQKSRRLLWEHDFSKQKTITQGLYYKMGHDAKSYATLMEEGMNEAVKDLDKKLSSMSVESLKK